MEKESNLEDLKRDYKEIQKKYNLPSFEDLNQNFQIEKISEVETDYILREIRKFIADKFSNYLRFIEAMLNPMNVPMFIFSLIKTIGPEEKDKLTKIYKKFAKIEVEIISLDLVFSEDKDAEFIKKSYEVWEEVKKELSGILKVVEGNWENKSQSNEKGYYR